MKQKYLEMFTNVHEFVKIYIVKHQIMKVKFFAVENQLAILVKNFTRYFVTDQNLIAKSERVRDPLQKSFKSLN